MLLYSILRTPTEEIWEGVSELPDYKATFPKWNDLCLTNQVQRLSGDKDGMDLLSQMLIYAPQDRISAKAAISHPFFKDFDRACLPTFDDEIA